MAEWKDVKEGDRIKVKISGLAVKSLRGKIVTDVVTKVKRRKGLIVICGERHNFYPELADTLLDHRKAE